MISLGQNQGSRATKLINEGWQQGNWVILENCHVEESWLAELDKIQLKVLQTAINEDFRLWCITKPIKSFPTTIIRNSIKLTYDPPRDLRSTALKHFSTDPLANDKFFSYAFNEKKLNNFWLKNVFALVILHAVVNERKQYGSLGWNRIYDFGEDDLTNCVLQLRQFIKQFGEIPYEGVHDFLNASNYGGQITDPRDQRLLSSLLQKFFNRNIEERENYRFFESSDIRVPKEPNKINYLDFIDGLICKNQAENVGLNSNADTLRNNSEVEKVSTFT